MSSDRQSGGGESIVSKLDALRRRLAGRTDTEEVPIVPAVCHVDPGNQWYDPCYASASSFSRAATHPVIIRRALAVLEQLGSDPYNRFVIEYYRRGLSTFGDNWRFADINTVLLALVERLRPRTYLEIGVRTGRSMAMVSSIADNCRLVGFDLWEDTYAGMPNPGPDFVESEVRRLGHKGAIELHTGDSAHTVPGFYQQNPNVFPELVTVDGAHDRAGATTDLQNVIRRLPIGGGLVFDDIANPSHPELRNVWKRTVEADDRFSSWTFDELGFGVAFAIRRK
jgi:predicted O-methyltransferase YrrM